MTMHKALNPKDYIDYMCQEKKEENEWLALKITSIYWHDDSKTT